jgi:hypothetical protein
MDMQGFPFSTSWCIKRSDTNSQLKTIVGATFLLHPFKR